MRRNVNANKIKVAANNEHSKQSTVKDDEEKVVNSVERFYKIAFVTAAVGVGTTVTNKLITGTPLDPFELFNVMYEVVLGVGAYRVWCISVKINSQTLKTNQDFTDLFQSQKALWRQSAIALLLGAVTIASSFQDASVWLKRIPVFQKSPSLAILLLGLSSIPFLYKNSKDEIQKAEAKGKPANSDYLTARVTGYAAIREMRLSIWAFALLGLVQLGAALLNNNIQTGGLIAMVLGLLDVSESIAMSKLLNRFAAKGVNAVVLVTSEGGMDKPEMYKEVMDVQTEFFDKSSDALKSVSWAKVVTFLIAGGRAALKV